MIDGLDMAKDPGSKPYEAARKRVAKYLRAIGSDAPKSRYREMAEDLMEGDLMQLPTWVALQLLAEALYEREKLQETFRTAMGVRVR